MRVEELSVKLVTGKSASSSSLNSGDGGSSGIVEPSEMKESWVRLCEGKRACLVWWMGDDSGNPCPLFHERRRADGTRCLRPVIGPEDGNFCKSDGRILLLLWLLPERWNSSEKMGAVRGDEARPPLLDCSRLEVVEAVSEIVSLLEAGLFLCSRSSTCASMTSRLIFSQPF